MTRHRRTDPGPELDGDKTIPAESGGERTDLLAFVSHEVRGSLHTIVGALDSLSQRHADRESEALVATALEAADAAMGMLSDVLDLAKATAGALTPRQLPFDPSEAVERVVLSERPRAMKKGVVLSASFDRRLPTSVLGDEHRIERVLSNLVQNAVRFTDRGTVAVRVFPASTPHLVRFEVEDSGIGLSAIERDRLFRPFVQAESARGGTGLGLSFAKAVVESFSGRIGCESALKCGSLFWFEIPLPAPNAEVPVPRRLETHGKPRVLVVEDHPTNQELMRSWLERFGFEVSIVGRGDEAEEAWAAYDPAMVLMDGDLPGISGAEAVLRIRAREGGVRRTAILMITGSTDPADAEAARRAGADDVLHKPIRRHELARKLDRYIAIDQDRVASSSRDTPVARGLSKATTTGEMLRPFAPPPTVEAAPRSDALAPGALMLRQEEAPPSSDAADDGIDPVVKTRILGMYAEDVPPRLEAMKRAAGDGNLNELMHLAHALRGASASLGLTRVATIAKDLELASKAFRAEESRTKLVELEFACSVELARIARRVDR